MYIRYKTCYSGITCDVQNCVYISTLVPPAHKFAFKVDPKLEITLNRRII